MKKNKGTYKGTIISAALGGVFFAIPYIGLGVSILPSLGMAALAFGAGNLLLSEPTKELESNDKKSMYDILKNAKRQNAEIYAMMNKVEDRELINNLREVHETAKKIIDTVEKDPNKLDKAKNFFNYYLPVTLKILMKYDDIENQELDAEECQKIMDSTEEMIMKINKSFKIQLANLYQSDIIDTDAEIKVVESMLSADGFNEDNNIDIK